jgi:hypothetical protein
VTDHDVSAIHALPPEGRSFSLTDGLSVLVYQRAKAWTFTIDDGVRDGVPVEIPRRARSGISTLSSPYHRRRVLDGILGPLKLPEKSDVAVIVEDALTQTMNTLLQLELGTQAALEASTQEAPHVLTEAQRQEAQALLSDEDFIDTVLLPKLEQAGLVGEKELAKCLWLQTVTRFFKTTVSANLKADSSTGKNFALNLVLEFVPPEDVVRFTRATANALYYVEELDLAHKVLVIEEAAGADEALYSVRGLQEAGELRLLVPMKDEEGQLRSKELVVKGPCVVFMTTTQSALEEDEETRTLSYSLHADKEQTRAIVESQGDLYDSKQLLAEAEKERIRNVQRLVRETLASEGLLGREPFECVCAPWMGTGALGTLFPADEVRARRDSRRLYTLVAAQVALSSPVSKARDARGRIVADVLRDYEPVRSAFNAYFVESVTNLNPLSRQVLEAATELVEEKAAKASTKNSRIDEEPVLDRQAQKVKRGEIAKRLGWSENRTRRWAAALEGLYLHVEEGGQGKPYVYSVRSSPPNVELPSAEAVKVAYMAMLDRAEGEPDAEGQA